MNRFIIQAVCHLAAWAAVLIFTSGLDARPPQSPTQQQGEQAQELPVEDGAGQQRGQGQQKGKQGKGKQGKGGKGKGKGKAGGKEGAPKGGGAQGSGVDE